MHVARLTLLALGAALISPIAQSATPNTVWQNGGLTMSLYGPDAANEAQQNCINNRLQPLVRQMRDERLKPVGEALNFNHPIVLALLDGASVKVVPVVGGRTEYWFPLKPDAKSVIVRRNGINYEGVASAERTPLPDLLGCLAGR